MCFKKHCSLFFFLLVLFSSNCGWAQTGVAPTITASGDQIYCPLSQMKVVTSFNITDPDDTTVDAFYFQISEGYKISENKILHCNRGRIQTSHHLGMLPKEN